MAQVATIIRLPQDEYREYRKLALDREVNLKRKELSKRKVIFKRIWETRIPVNTSVTELIHQGRRFEDE